MQGRITLAFCVTHRVEGAAGGNCNNCAILAPAAASDSWKRTDEIRFPIVPCWPYSTEYSSSTFSARASVGRSHVFILGSSSGYSTVYNVLDLQTPRYVLRQQRLLSRNSGIRFQGQYTAAVGSARPRRKTERRAASRTTR